MLNVMLVTVLCVAMPCTRGLRLWPLAWFEKLDVGAVTVLSTAAGTIDDVGLSL